MVALSDARWLNGDRVNGYAKIFLGVTIGLAAWRLVSVWADGCDFVAFWTAARMALAGVPAAAYDMPALFVAEAEEGFPRVAFVSPPPFLALVSPLGGLPYPVALAMFSVLTFAALALALRWMPKGLYWPALAFPVSIVSIIFGQTGMLTSALLMGALGLLPRHKVGTGLLIAALVIKPQIAVLVPIALMAGREWRAFGAAAVGSIVLLGGSVALFGVETLAASMTAQSAVSDLLLSGRPSVTLAHMQSVYRLALSTGLSVPAALSVQAVVALAAAAAVWYVWRRQGDPLARASILCAATPLAAPYVLTYDLGILIVPICWLAREGARHGFRPWERLALVAGFLSPLVLQWYVDVVALGPLVCLALLATVLLRLGPRLHALDHARGDQHVAVPGRGRVADVEPAVRRVRGDGRIGRQG